MSNQERDELTTVIKPKWIDTECISSQEMLLSKIFRSERNRQKCHEVAVGSISSQPTGTFEESSTDDNLELPD